MAKYVFLQGMGQQAQVWNAVTIQLPTHYTIDCPELLAHRNAENSAYPSIYNDFATRMQGETEAFHLCGLSMGGVIALQYAIEHPEKIASLVLIGTQFKMPKNLLRVQNLIVSILPKRVFEKSGTNKSQMLTMSKSMTDLDFSEQLGQIHCPCLILCGGKDVANKKSARLLTQRILGAQYQEIACGGHALNQDSPNALAKVLQTFWEQQ